MKKKKVLLVLGLSGSAAMILASCGGNKAIVPTDTGSGVYTLRETDVSTPTNWNPHTWEMSNDTYVTGYTEMGLVDLAKKSGSTDYEFVYEMASAITDVTKAKSADATFAAKWLTSKDSSGKDVVATENRVWQIDLNKDAKWADGTVINADTYIESMQEDLDPTMKNYRATTYYTGDVAIDGAKRYFNSNTSMYFCYDDKASAITDGGTLINDKLWVNWPTSYIMGQLAAYKISVDDFSAKKGGAYAGELTNSAGECLVDKYASGTELTDAVINDFIDTDFGHFWFDSDDSKNTKLTADNVKEFFGSYYIKTAVVEWDTVGILKTGDYQFLYITVDPVTEFYFKTNMTSNWIVKKDIYDANKVTTGGLTTSKYGTSVATYMGFGPYKMDSFEKDKQIKFSRNENWYGWKDGKHEGQYKTTNIELNVMPKHETALLAFQKGDLDSLTLEQADVSKYGYSDYILHTPETYTKRLVFDSNKTDLKKLEANANDGANKQILAQYDFRKAISLSINRKQFCTEATSGHEPAFGLLNNLYYYNVENDPSSIYRNTKEAKQAIVDLYGLEYGSGKKYADLDAAYAAVTGLDVAQAKTLFQSAYDAAIKDGSYTKGQKINLDFGVYDATLATNIAEAKVLNENVAAATVGTDLEGMITFTPKSFNGDTTRYDAITGGTIEIADCAWGGAAFWPFSGFDVYTGANGYEYNEARSWDPKAVDFKITYDFNGDGTDEEVTHTFYDWEALLTDNTATGLGKAKMEVRLYVLSRLEYGLLDQYNFAVVSSYGSASLFSMKIKYATTTYNSMYGYGGLRWMDYTCDDTGWANFVTAMNGTLNYE